MDPLYVVRGEIVPYNKERLLQLKERYAKADQDLCTIKDPEHHNVEYIHDRLKDYFQTRLLLTDADMESDDLKTLIERSLKKQEELLQAGVKLEDVLAPGCAGITGAAAKKIYLFLTVQNLLSVKLNEKQTPYIETLTDLAEELLPLL